MTKKTMRDIDLAGKTVLVRVDYNVPIEHGKVGDTLRIKSSFDTIKYLRQQDCRIVLVSHLGRPVGKSDLQYSLRPVAAMAAELLGQPIKFASDCIGAEAEAVVGALAAGEIVLLENLRFHAEEEANDAAFAKSLAKLGQVYVDDAFAAIHRAHASTVGVTKYLPAVAGLLVEREVDTITKALEKPQRPLLAIIGGAKVSTKIEVLSNLINKADAVMIGGAMANTFLAASGYQVGKSTYEPDQIKTAQEIMASADNSGVDLVLPVDLVVARRIDRLARPKTVDLIGVGPKDIIVDIGPKTVRRGLQAVKVTGTVIWNGPVGIAEIPKFAAGSLGLARQIINLNVASLIGGGDTAAFIDAAGLHDEFDFVSTGGGASLELIAGTKLPGVEALLDK